MTAQFPKRIAYIIKERIKEHLIVDPPSQPNVILVIPKRSYLESRNGTTLLIYLALIFHHPSTINYSAQSSQQDGGSATRWWTFSQSSQRNGGSATRWRIFDTERATKKSLPAEIHLIKQKAWRAVR